MPQERLPFLSPELIKGFDLKIFKYGATTKQLNCFQEQRLYRQGLWEGHPLQQRSLKPRAGHQTVVQLSGTRAPKAVDPTTASQTGTDVRKNR